MGIKFPTPWKTLMIKFPPPRDGKGVKCPGYARGGTLKLRFDRYISQFSEMPFERRYHENHGTNTVHSQPVPLIGTELKILALIGSYLEGAKNEN